jgi:hypothetical protein
MNTYYREGGADAPSAGAGAVGIAPVHVRHVEFSFDRAVGGT